MTRKFRKKTTGSGSTGDLKLLDDLIKRCFRTIMKKIEEDAKLGDLLKMIELRRKLAPVDASQKELWSLLEQVRRDVLGTQGTTGKKKPASKKTPRKS